QERVDIGGVLVGKHLLRIGRHVVRRLAQEGDERFDRHFQLCERRRRVVHRTALPGAAVAGEAYVGEVDPFAVGRIARGRVLAGRRRSGGHCRKRKRGHDGTRRKPATLSHVVSPQRGSVTTSISAGWPLLTTATARLMAGPRSLGSVMG